MRLSGIGSALAALAALAWLACAPGAPHLEFALRAAGLGADHVTISGHVMTPEADLVTALRSGEGGLPAAFALAAAKRRIEELPWVEAAEVRAVFPNGIEIRVKEREAFAVWRHDGGEEAIDAAGRRLGTAPEDATALPVVAGEGAAAAAPAMLAALAAYPHVVVGLARLDRVAGRRWTVRLRNGSVVHLPAIGEAAALRRAAQTGILARASATADAVFDLRGNGAAVSVRIPPPVEASS